MTKRTVLNMYDAWEAAKTLSRVQKTMQLHNDFINQVPEPEGITDDEAKVRYALLYKSMENLQELNQHLMDELDGVYRFLDNIGEAMKEEMEEHDKPF